jgi:hypothetical protein
MQVDSKYGIIPDTEAQILSNYLSFFQNVFPNANSPDDPTYVIASICSYFDELNQSALEGLWNTKNSDTASGIGLDILANTVLNLFRKSITPSTCILKIVVQNLLSFCDIQIDVTVASAQQIPANWVVSGSVSPSPAYTPLVAFDIPSSGVYTVRVYSTDVTTAVPIAAFNAGAAVPNITFITVSNPGIATLGSLVIPPTWAVTASTITNSPVYTPNQYYTYTANGTYYLLLYSNDILTDINIGKLNTFTQINNLNPTPAPMIASITNLNPNVLGLPAESDAQFAQRRRYYLNIEGQTYFGLEKVILNIGAPALKSVFVSETITETYTPSIMIIQITVTYVATPIDIPVNWTVYGTAVPSPLYKTNSSYSYSASGTYYIPVFSTDATTAIPIGDITSGDVITGVSGVTNVSPAIFETTIGLGQRGYTVYLNYPALGAGGTFDLQDIYLQQIASACFEYHPLGTQFYSGGAGNTTFTVRTPYSGYTSEVILNPLVISEATVTLTLVYNVDPEDAGFSNGIFPVNLITGTALKTQLIDLINAYFNSKTLPTDLVFSINELSELIQAAYTGIVSLNTSTVPFTLGTISPSATGRVFLRRPIGYVFNLTDANFTFNAVNKDSL